jgi:hypothetical protein
VEANLDVRAGWNANADDIEYDRVTQWSAQRKDTSFQYFLRIIASASRGNGKENPQLLICRAAQPEL